MYDNDYTIIWRVWTLLGILNETKVFILNRFALIALTISLDKKAEFHGKAEDFHAWAFLFLDIYDKYLICNILWWDRII